MTRRLVKLKKSTKEVVLLKSNPEEEPKPRTTSVSQPHEEFINLPFVDDVRAANLKEGILIGPQAFDPGVEKLNALKGEVELAQGTNITINKDSTNNKLTINAGDSGVLTFNNRAGTIILNGESPIQVVDNEDGSFTIKDTSSVVVDFSPLAEISTIHVPQSATVRQLREAVNSMAVLLTNFYNTNK